MLKSTVFGNNELERCKAKRPWPMLWYYFIYLEGLRRTMRSLSEWLVSVPRFKSLIFQICRNAIKGSFNTFLASEPI
jgi:hypothetical protein